MVCDCAEFKEKTQDLQLHHVVFFNLQRKIKDQKLRKNMHIYTGTSHTADFTSITKMTQL